MYVCHISMVTCTRQRISHNNSQNKEKNNPERKIKQMWDKIKRLDFLEAAYTSIPQSHISVHIFLTDCCWGGSATAMSGLYPQFFPLHTSTPVLGVMHLTASALLLPSLLPLTCQQNPILPLHFPQAKCSRKAGWKPQPQI